MKSCISTLSALVLGLISLENVVLSAPNCDDNSKLQYEAGKSYVYNVELVSYSGFKDEDNLRFRPVSGYKTEGTLNATGKLVLTALENCQYVATLDVVARINGQQGNSAAGGSVGVPRSSLKFTFRDGEVSNLFKAEGSQPWTTNMLRGVLTMIQNHAMANTEGTPHEKEEGILGECLTRLFVPTENTYTKKIHMQKCSGAIHSRAISEGMPYVTPAFSKNTGLRFDTSSVFCTQTVENGLIAKTNCSESDNVPFSKFKLDTISKLELVDSAKDPEAVGGASGDEISRLTDPTMIVYDTTQNVPDVSWEASLQTSIVEIINTMYTDKDANKAALYLELKDKLKYMKNLAQLEEKLVGTVGENVLQVQFVKNIIREVSTEIVTNAAVLHLTNLINTNELSQGATAVFYSNLVHSKDPSPEGIQAIGQNVENTWTIYSTDPSFMAFDFSGKKKIRKMILGASAYAYRFCQRFDCETQPDYIKLVNSIANFTTSNQPEIAPAAMYALGNVYSLPAPTVDIIKAIFDADNTNILNRGKKLIAFEAFRRQPCEPTLKLAAKQLLESSSQPLELRVESYLAITRCLVEDDLKLFDQILQNPEVPMDLKSFVASHIYNIMDSQSPSKDRLKEGLLSKVGIPEGILSVHNITKATKYFEFSTYDPIPNFGFSVDGHSLFPKGNVKPSFATVNVTLDLFGKSYNIFQLGFSRRLIPNIVETFMHSNENSFEWYASMLPSIISVDSYLRVYGTTVSMGLDIFDSLKPHQFIDSIEDKELGLNRFELVRPFTLIEEELVVPTITGFPLSSDILAAYLPMISVNHSGESRGLRMIDLFTNWHETGNFRFNSTSSQAFSFKTTLEVGKGTPVRMGSVLEGKVHSNHSIGLESIKSPGESKWNKRIDFPENIVWSKRMTGDHRFFVELEGKLVKSWSVNGDGSSEVATPTDLFTFEKLGLRFNAKILNTPVPPHGGPLDVMLIVDKTEDTFSGYNLDVEVKDGDEKYRQIHSAVLKADGLSTGDAVHFTMNKKEVTVFDLVNDNDKPTTDITMDITISYAGHSNGYRFTHISEGATKSKLDANDPNTELTNGGILVTPSFGMLHRHLYGFTLSQLEGSSPPIELISGTCNNNPRDFDISIKFGGLLHHRFGTFNWKFSKPIAETIVNNIDSEMSHESRHLGKTRLVAKTVYGQDPVIINFTLEAIGNTFELHQTLSSPNSLKRFEPRLEYFTEYIYNGDYKDSLNNAGTVYGTYYDDYKTDESSQVNWMKNATLTISSTNSPFKFEAHAKHHQEMDMTRDMFEDKLKHLLATFDVSMNGNQHVDYKFDQVNTLAVVDTTENCRGTVVTHSKIGDNDAFVTTTKCISTTINTHFNIPNELFSELNYTNENPSEVITYKMKHFRTHKEIDYRSEITTTDKGAMIHHKWHTTAVNIPHFHDTVNVNGDTSINLPRRSMGTVTTVVKKHNEKTKTWRSQLNVTIAPELLNGKHTLRLKASCPKGNLNVDVDNTISLQKDVLNSTLIAIIAHNGRTKIAIPKKQFTWILIEDFSLDDSQKTVYDLSIKGTNSMKLEILDQPTSSEIFHVEEKFNLFKMTQKQWYNGDYNGELMIGGKEIGRLGTSGEVHINTGVTPSDVSASKLDFTVNGWIGQDTPELRNNTLFEHITYEFSPVDHKGKETIEFLYKRLDTQTGQVLTTIAVDSVKDFIVRSWNDFSLHEVVSISIDNKNSTMTKDIRVEGAHVKVHLVNQDKDKEDNSWMVDFAGGVYEERHQHKFNIRSRIGSNNPLIKPTTDFNVTISRRR